MTVARPAGPYVQVFAATAGGPVRWRMLTGNNRELGRGAQPAPDVAGSVADYEWIVDRLDDLVVSSSTAATHRWSWKLSLASEVLVVAGHSFDRRSRCEMAVAQFLREAPRAVVRERVLLTQPRGRVRLVPHPTAAASWHVVHPALAGRSGASVPMTPGTAQAGSQTDGSET